MWESDRERERKWMGKGEGNRLEGRKGRRAAEGTLWKGASERAGTFLPATEGAAAWINCQATNFANKRRRARFWGLWEQEGGMQEVLLKCINRPLAVVLQAWAGQAARDWSAAQICAQTPQFFPKITLIHSYWHLKHLNCTERLTFVVRLPSNLANNPLIYV